MDAMAPQPECSLHDESHRWAPNPKGGYGLFGPGHCQHVKATKHLSMPILGEQPALRIVGGRCSARAGSEAGRRVQRGHWRSWQDVQLLGTVVCSGTGEGSAGRGALSQGSGQEQMFPVGHCRLGFPEVHMTPGTALGRDPEGWPWSAQRVQPCFPAWSTAEKPGRQGCVSSWHTPLARKARLSPVNTGHPSLADWRAAPGPPQPLTPPCIPTTGPSKP